MSNPKDYVKAALAPFAPVALCAIVCLIAACALRHDLTVLHRDRDYPALAGISNLRERRV